MRVAVALLGLLGTCLAQYAHNCAPGRTVFVHLFEWRWDDIAKECENFLGPNGYCAVQISPPNEHRIIRNPSYPWYQRYQPVSYKLQSRSGSRSDFIDMVQRCNNVNVRIYVDTVVNHMTSGGGGVGSGGSTYDGDTLSFPGVPFSASDFSDCSKCGTSNCAIQDYNNIYQLRNCRLFGLVDLNMKEEYVLQKVSSYMNDLLATGVAGFRIDAAKHLWPADIANLLGRLNNLNTKWFPSNSKPFIFQEVIDLGNGPIKGSEYFPTGKVSEFKYGQELGITIREGNQLRLLKEFGQSRGFYPDQNAVVFTDNHDNQRGHGTGGETVLTFKEPRKYKIANAFMLAWPYGYPKVMSSYRWQVNSNGGEDKNDWLGPPGRNGKTNRVQFNDDNSCFGGWVCEHRWTQIYNMVGFRNAAGSEPVRNWWDNGSNQIAFSRGNKAFIAINNEQSNMSIRLNTGLPQGIYCDVISGHKVGSSCSGGQVTVDGNGSALIQVSATTGDPILAIHEGSKL